MKNLTATLAVQYLRPIRTSSGRPQSAIRRAYERCLVWPI